MEKKKMQAVVSVVGKDMVGILAKVSTVCAEKNANVVDVTQAVLDGYFCMVMVIEIDQLTCELFELQEVLREKVEGMAIHVMHEDIFQAMHTI